MTPRNRLRLAIAIGVAVVAYVWVYSSTTTVRSQGTGGLSGPLRVRVFKNENHLIAFYPLYLVERWIRNGSLVDASYRFNSDLEDGRYARDWLYGDGKYSRIWYDFW